MTDNESREIALVMTAKFVDYLMEEEKQIEDRPGTEMVLDALQELLPDMEIPSLLSKMAVCFAEGFSRGFEAALKCVEAE